MKITDIRFFTVDGGKDWVFVKVYTDAGITGLGEMTVDQHARAVVAFAEDLRDYYTGKDPLRITHHWQRVFRNSFWRSHLIQNAVMAGFNTAMWDIFGKFVDQPIYALLGGACRDKIRAYTHAGIGETIENAVRSAVSAVEKGYMAFKTLPPLTRHVEGAQYMRQLVDRFRALREAVGDDVDIALDAHGRFSPAMAVRVSRALEEFNILFLEEPVLPEHTDALRRVAPEIPVPIATGERLFSKFSFTNVLDFIDIAQPDLVNVGGITEMHAIAQLCEAHYVALAPHNPLSPVNTAASLHIAAASPNFLIQEVPRHDGDLFRSEIRLSILDKNIETIEDGYLQLPPGPGLGVELNEQVALRNPAKGLLFPEATHTDGSVADR